MSVQASALVKKESDRSLTLSGTLLEPDVHAVRKEGERLLGELGGGGCTVDVTGLNNASSIVLSLLLCWKREAVRRNIDLRFEGANERLFDLAEMSHVAGYLGLEGA